MKNGQPESLAEALLLIEKMKRLKNRNSKFRNSKMRFVKNRLKSKD